jgi:ParB-like chromosome segregation protein Spo0J
MQIETININEINPYKNNAKVHTKEQIEQIKKSIQDFGNNDPIAIDENNVIIEGHGRLIALRELGFNKVEIIRLSHLTDKQKKAYILTHNKLTMNTGFDFDILNTELEFLKTDIDMSDFGFVFSDDVFSKKDQLLTDCKELNLNDFDDESFKFECPRCKFRWNDE